MFSPLFSRGHGGALRRLGLLVTLVFVGLCDRGLAEEVLRKPPAIYEEKLKPLLTPIEEVLKNRDIYTSKDGSGVILLDEEIDYVDEEGRHYNVEHMVYGALTEAGIEGLAQDTYSFRRAYDKIYLIEAHTILADGSRREVQGNAAFLKSPQYDANNALYDDGGELIVMFPNVGLGTITEAIVLTEQEKPLIPGEFTRRFAWRSSWPKVKVRRLVDLPTGVAERLKITTRGENLPTMQRENLPGNRTRFIWEKDKDAAEHWEENRPPIFQSGPYVWLSTMSTWEPVAKWYADLLKDRQTLSPELAAQVDEWTREATTPQQIIDILSEKVSRDVRYVGLEFGLAGFQPASCNTVWANRYGDCKDKANLLRAMLKHKGIATKLVFLETDHAGIVEKRSPDYRQFSHVILAAEASPGEWVYIDPTIRYGWPGLLSPSDADREVFLLDGEKYEWARTPEGDAGEVRYEFDLKRDAHGDLQGWVHMRASGYYAARYHEDFLSYDRDAAVREVGSVMRTFFPSAEIMDVETKLGEPRKDGFSYRAYLVVPSGGQEAASTVTLPFHRSMMPRLSKDGKRQTPDFLWKDVTVAKINLELPEGTRPQTVPPPYDISTPQISGQGKWQAEGNHLSGEIHIEVKASLIKPSEYPVFKNAINSMETWVSRPVILGASDGSALAAEPTATPADVTLENFPLMPTAEGQRDLLEKVFPPSASQDLRRKAFTKLQQYFPNDKETKFYVGINFALLDFEQKKSAQEAEAMEKLINLYRGTLEPRWVVWGEYQLAFAYLELDDPRAQTLFAKISEDPAANDFRKAWSCYHVANLTKDQDLAIATLRKGVALDTNSLARQLPLLAQRLSERGELETLRPHLTQIAGWKSETAEAGLVSLAETSPDLPKESETALQQMILEVAGENEVVADAVKKARSTSQAKLAWGSMRDRLGLYLTEHPQMVAAEGRDKSIAKLKSEIESASEASDAQRTLGLTLALLTHPEIGDEFPTVLWQAASRASWVDRVRGEGTTGPLLPLLLQLCSEAPADQDVYHEGKYVEAQLLRAKGENARVVALISSLLESPDFNSAYENAFRKELGLVLEAQGKRAEAVANYLAVRDQMAEFSSAASLILRAVFLELDAGHWDEALGLLKDLSAIPESVRQKVDGVFQLNDMIQLARDPAAARTYWEASKGWSDLWLKVSSRLDPQAKAEELPPVPVIRDILALGSSLGDLARSRNTPPLRESWNLLIAAARWSPALAVEASTVAWSAGPLFSRDATQEANEFFYAMLKSLPDLHGRSRDLMMAGFLCDMGRGGEALPLVQKILADGSVDEVNFAARRLHGIIGYEAKEERPAAIAALEECLAMPDSISARAMTVNILARLYELEGLREQELALLQREVDHPRIKGTSDEATLRQTMEKLTSAAAGGEAFTAYFQSWMSKRKPSWYDHARPQALDRSAYEDFTAVLDSPTTYFKPEEIPKFHLLVAADESLPGEQRLAAFKQAWYALADSYPRESQLVSLMQDSVGDPRLDESLQSDFFWVTLYTLAFSFHKEPFAKLISHPLTEKFSPEALDVLRTMADSDRFQAASLEKTFATLTGKPATDLSLAAMEEVFRSVLMLGDLEAAQRMYDRLGKVTLAPGTDGSLSALKLNYLKQLKQARRWVPVQTALREAALKYYPAESIRKPANYDDLADVADSDLCYVDNARDVLLYRILKRQIAPENLEFWSDFALRVGSAKDAPLRAELARIMIEQAPDDQTKSDAVFEAASTVDLDDPDARLAFQSWGKPYADVQKWPETSKAFYLRNALAALRAGEDATFEDQIVNKGSSRGVTNTEMLSVKYYYARNDVEKLKAALNAADIDDLMSEVYLDTSIGAFAAAGMEDEAELAREEGRKVLDSLVLQSWIEPDTSLLISTLDLAEALDLPSAIPDAWGQDLSERVRDSYARSILQTGLARLRKNWAELARASAEAIKLYPYHYHFYFLQGEALYHLGRKAEALESLRIYAAHAHDERNCWQAGLWIEELEGQPETVAK